MELISAINGKIFPSFFGFRNNPFNFASFCLNSKNPILIMKANAVTEKAFSVSLSDEKFLQKTMLVKKTGAFHQKRKGAWLDTNF
jgi:hypothetical protein